MEAEAQCMLRERPRRDGRDLMALEEASSARHGFELHQDKASS